MDDQNFKMKKILVITESINIEDSSASKVNVALIVNLKKIGYNVKVLHYTRKDIQLKDIKCISIPERKFSINYFLSRSQRIFQRIFRVNISRPLEHIFGNSFTFFNDSKSISKFIKKHYDDEELIITLSMGGSFRPHYAMLSLPQLHNIWLAYVHDPFPFHYYPRPYNWVQAGYRFKESFFKEISEKAKYSGFPSLLLKEWMGSYFPNFLKTGIIIPHQSISKNTNQQELPKEFPSFFDKNKFNILHAGNLMMPRPPKGLIEAYKLFLRNNKEAAQKSKLIFVGNANYYKDYLNAEISENIYWSKGYLKYDIVNKLQRFTAVNVILESKSEISPFLPGKFPDCIIANKPILLLCPYYSESKRLLGNNYKYIAENDDIEKISQIIESLYFNWKKDINYELGRKDLLHYCSEKYLIEVFKNEIKL